MLVKEFIKPCPNFVLLDISAYSKETGGECFGVSVGDLLNKDEYSRYLEYDVIYICPELCVSSYCLTTVKTRETCILLDIELREE